MAAIYDALGNYVGDDGAGAGNTPADIAKMRAALGAKLEARSPLARPKSAAMQQLEAIDAKPLSIDDIYYRLTTPLAKPISRFESLQRDMATLPQQVSDVTNTLFGNPFQMMVRTPIEALITGKTSTPEVNALLEKNTAPMQTPQGAEFASAMGKAFEESKLPHAWPMMPGGLPRRPMLTGSDVLALKGDAARLATQLREVPADFQAAQTGFQRIDPITGKPTIGSRLQSLADEWASISERRQSLQDESPFAAATSPEIYAIRKKGTKLIQPTKPETAMGASFSVDPATNIVRSVAGASRELSPYNLFTQWRNYVESELPNEILDGMREYVTERKMEMYPDLGPLDARRAFDRAYTERNANAAKTMELYTQYLNLPEVRAVAERTGANIITPTDFTQRHAAAVDWLQGPFSNYLVRNVGTEGDPLVALAAQGLTYESPARVREMASYVQPSWVRPSREAAGFPAEGLVGIKANEKMGQLLVAQDELQAMQDRRNTLLAQAEARGVDPATIPEYAALTNPLRVKGRQIQQLEKEIEDLKTGMAYETISDAAVIPRTPKEFLERDIDPYEQPFYPSATRAAEGETIYAGRETQLENELGFGQIAQDFYNDVVQGNIPTDQLKNLTVEKYVRKGAEKRMVKEAEEARIAQMAKQKTLDAAQKQLGLAQITLPKTKVIEMDSSMSPDTIAKVLSLDTLVLDHCVGQCGQAPEGSRNLFTDAKQSYKPIFDFAKDEFTGGKDPSEFSYVQAVIEGNKRLASMRDTQTGLPVVTIELTPRREGGYSVGYVSGAKNGQINSEYSNDVAEYMNRYADNIKSMSNNVSENAGVFDTKNNTDFRLLARNAERRTDVPTDVIRSIDYSTAPRFMTQKQFDEFVKQNSGNVVPTTEPIVASNTDIIPAEINNNLQALNDLLDQRVDQLEYIREQDEDLARVIYEQDLQPGSEEHIARTRLRAEENRVIDAIDIIEGRIAELQLQPTLPTPDLIPPEIANDPQALMNYGNQQMARLTGAEETIAVLESQEMTPENMRVLQDFRDVHQHLFRTIRAVNDRIRDLRAAQELPPPPAEVQVPQLRGQVEPLANLYDDLGLETDWTDINNRGATLPADEPMPQPIMRMSNNALIEFLTPADFGNVGEIITHLRDQLFNTMQEAHVAGVNVDEERQNFISTMRENPTAFFGDESPYLIEYALRVIEHRIEGYAKGGTVKKKVQMTKSIPAMRAELLRRA